MDCTASQTYNAQEGELDSITLKIQTLTKEATWQLEISQILINHLLPGICGFQNDDFEELGNEYNALERFGEILGANAPVLADIIVENALSNLNNTKLGALIIMAEIYRSFPGIGITAGNAKELIKKINALNKLRTAELQLKSQVQTSTSDWPYETRFGAGSAASGGEFGQVLAEALHDQQPVDGTVDRRTNKMVIDALNTRVGLGSKPVLTAICQASNSPASEVTTIIAGKIVDSGVASKRLFANQKYLTLFVNGKLLA